MEYEARVVSISYVGESENEPMEMLLQAFKFTNNSDFLK